MDACFDGMFKLTEIPGISGWDTGSCVSFSSVFFNCTSLQRVDISHWSNRSCMPGPQSWGYVPFGHSGGGYHDLEYVKIGAGWDHVGDLLRNTYSLMKVTGADGNWYALSDGNAYSSATAPDNKADTYYTTKALLDQAKTPTAFAVYSADDRSLDFYKRPRYMMPISGSTFEGKAATAVYTGFETASYGKKAGSDSYIPWASVAGSVLSAEVVDDGIAPISIAHWFDYFYELRTCDLGKLNVANVTSMDGTFYQNYALSSLTMPTSEFSSLVDMSSAFTVCSSLKSVDLSRVNFSNITDLAWTFSGCNILVLDCSDWDVSNVASYGNFNTDAPGVILPKAWQPTAFAVFSADDGSLDFYKREFKDVPSGGDTFEGKAVTEVYTGFENTRYSIQTSDDGAAHDWTCKALPWWNRRDSVKTATVVDTGIAPTSICGWFMRMSNLTAADLSNLDCSGTYTAWCAFLRCTSLTSLKSPMNFNPIDLSDFVYSCNNLKDLDTSSWNMGRCTNIGWAFAGCESLETLRGVEGWDTSSLNYADGAFAYCNLLKLDCSNWNVASSTYNVNFNQGTPYITLPKAWQTVSADIASGGDGVADDAEAAGGGDIGAGDGSVSESSSPIGIDNSLA